MVQVGFLIREMSAFCTEFGMIGTRIAYFLANLSLPFLLLFLFTRGAVLCTSMILFVRGATYYHSMH